MLFISHDLATVRYVSDHIAVMHLGRVVECAPVDDLLADPKHPYTRTLLESSARDAPPLRDTPPMETQTMDAEPPDPREPPSGYRFHTRCPAGPALFPERVSCTEDDPHAAAVERPHQAACHFAEAEFR